MVSDYKNLIEVTAPFEFKVVMVLTTLFVGQLAQKALPLRHRELNSRCWRGRNMPVTYE